MTTAGIEPDFVFCSPALRAFDTARLALSASGNDACIETDERLHEQDVGSWVGRLATDIFDEACMADVRALGKDFRPPGGESMNDVGRRMCDWLASLTRLRRGDVDPVVVAFTHGGAIRALASLLLHWTHSRTFAEKPANGSVSLFEYGLGDDTWSVRSLGVPHDALNGLPR